MNLERTRIHCPSCGTFHPADYVEIDGAAFWRVRCPKGDRDVGLSIMTVCCPTSTTCHRDRT